MAIPATGRTCGPGCRGAYAGDDPASPYYTADLLKPLGPEILLVVRSGLLAPIQPAGLSRLQAPARHQCLEERGKNPPETAAEGQDHRPDHGIVSTRHPQGRPATHGFHPPPAGPEGAHLPAYPALYPGGPGALGSCWPRRDISSFTPTWDCHARVREKNFSPCRTGPPWTAWRSTIMKAVSGSPPRSGS